MLNVLKVCTGTEYVKGQGQLLSWIYYEPIVLQKGDKLYYPERKTISGLWAATKNINNSEKIAQVNRSPKFHLTPNVRGDLNQEKTGWQSCDFTVPDDLIFSLFVRHSPPSGRGVLQASTKTFYRTRSTAPLIQILWAPYFDDTQPLLQGRLDQLTENQVIKLGLTTQYDHNQARMINFNKLLQQKQLAPGIESEVLTVKQTVILEDGEEIQSVRRVRKNMLILD